MPLSQRVRKGGETQARGEGAQHTPACIKIVEKGGGEVNIYTTLWGSQSSRQHVRRKGVLLYR